VRYSDSSYIAKFYLDACVATGQIEIAAVFHRKFREGAFAAGAFRRRAI